MGRNVAWGEMSRGEMSQGEMSRGETSLGEKRLSSHFLATVFSKCQSSIRICNLDIRRKPHDKHAIKHLLLRQK